MGKFSLSALSPFGPIFGKELRVTARRKRTYALRVLYLAALFLVMMLAYTETSSRFDVTVSVTERAQHEAELGGVFFIAFAIFSVYALAIISPILTATAVGSERLNRTLNVLLMTPITSWQIVSGKLFSRMLTSVSLIGLSLPVLAVVRLLGGVEISQMFGVIAVCLALSLAAAAIGLFYSTLINRAYAVILLSYATMLFWYLFLPMVLAALFLSGNGRFMRGSGRLWWDAFAATNPFFTVTANAVPGGMGRMFSPWPCVIVHLLFTTLIAIWCAAVIRRRSRREGESSTGVAPLEPISMPPPLPVPAIPLDDRGGTLPLHRPIQVMPYSSPPIAPYSRRLQVRDVSDNPVAWRELRRPLFTKRWQKIVGGALPLVLLLVTYISVIGVESSALGKVDLQIGYAIGFCALLSLLICVIAATTIAGEKESDTWTLLLATPLSARGIVLGKLAGIARRLAWPVGFVIGHFFLFTVTGVIPLPTFLFIIWVLITFNSLWVATGLYFSLKFQKVTFAVIINLLMPVIAYLAVLAVLTIAAGFAGGPGDNWGASFVGSYAPYPYLISGIEGVATWPYRNHTDPFWLAAGGRVPGIVFYPIVFAVGIGYLTLSMLVVAHTIYHFNKIVGRAPQRERLPRPLPA